MGNMKNLWKDRGITLDTKVKLVQTLVFPIVLSGAETWTLRKDLRKRIDAFELWCWRRILRTPWTARQTNSWVIGMINSKWTLESRVAKAMMSYFGHVSRAEGGMEKEVMMGQMEGKRGRGRPRRRRLDGIKEMTKEEEEEEQCGRRRTGADGRKSPLWSPGVGHDSTEHCDIVT